MIERYILSQMGAIWSEENKFKTMLEVEILACEAQADLGNIPPEALTKIKSRARFDIPRIIEIEEKVHHDIIAFLTNVGENVGEEARYIHIGLTSSDIIDTSLAVRMKEAGLLIKADLLELISILQERAKGYKDTVMIGRTHGVHAEPITFGLKMLLWMDECERNLARLEEAIKTISFGKLSGAVGTYAHIDPYVEEYVCKKLGLVPARLSTQILQRDRHAHFLLILAIIAASLEKFATEIRNLQRTDILEVEEGFMSGQKGSSAMPHKRNPITCEQITGLARLVRSKAWAALENVALWHERDLTHSSVERIIVPDACILTDYILVKFKGVMENLTVYEENMRRNLERTHGLIHSQRVLLALVNKGLSREEAYQIVQRHAMHSWQEGSDFKELIKGDLDIKKHLSNEEIEASFDLDYYLRHIETIFKRFGF
ncbi:TPA: adenylosuccinate lyase [bacterium]|nr:adenylosuccinate lyase [bacterium]